MGYRTLHTLLTVVLFANLSVANARFACDSPSASNAINCTVSGEFADRFEIAINMLQMQSTANVVRFVVDTSGAVGSDPKLSLEFKNPQASAGNVQECCIEADTGDSPILYEGQVGNPVSNTELECSPCHAHTTKRYASTRAIVCEKPKSAREGQLRNRDTLSVTH